MLYIDKEYFNCTMYSVYSNICDPIWKKTGHFAQTIDFELLDLFFLLCILAFVASKSDSWLLSYVRYKHIPSGNAKSKKHWFLIFRLLPLTQLTWSSTFFAAKILCSFWCFLRSFLIILLMWQCQQLY